MKRVGGRPSVLHDLLARDIGLTDRRVAVTGSRWSAILPEREHEASKRIGCLVGIPVNLFNGVQVGLLVGEPREMGGSAMVRLQRLTGMRPEDVCGIRAKDINMSDDIWLFEPEGHKNRWRGHSRVLPIGPQAQKVIRPYLVNRAIDAHLFSPIEAMEWRQEQRRKDRSGRETKIYPCETKRLERERKARKSRRGKGKRVPRSNYDTQSFYRAVQYAIKKAATVGVVIPSWSPNQLRHARGTEVRKTHGLEAAQVILGHRKADVTQVYAERDLDLAITIAKMTG